MSQLSEEDLRVVEEWRKKDVGVLEPIDMGRLGRVDGMAVVCADPGRFPDIYRHHRTVASSVIAPLTLFGGFFLVAEDSPLNRKYREDLAILHHIRIGRDLLGLEHVSLYPHWPCRAAAEANISLREAANLIARGIYRLQKEVQGIRSTTFFHVDYLPHREKDRMKSYIFKERAFEAWNARQ